MGSIRLAGATRAGSPHLYRPAWIVAVGLLILVAMLVIATRALAASDEFIHAATLTNTNGVVGDDTGYSVAVSADGSTMVVGVPDAKSDQGEAYVYTRGSNGWQTANEPDVLSASNGAANDRFGYSVSVSQDGSVIAVGAPDAAGGGTDRGTVYVFDRPPGGWAPQSTQNETTSAAGPANLDGLGSALALSPDGTDLAAGAPGYSASLADQGGVYVWSYNGSALSTVYTEPLIAADAAHDDDLGSSVAMPSDSLIYSGAPYHPGISGPGAVYGFSSESSDEVSGYAPWESVSKTELSASGSSQFGASVAAAGGIVAAGAPASSSEKGAVYLFSPSFRCVTELVSGCFSSSSPTTPLATLTDPSGAGEVGSSVAVAGDGAAVLAGASGYIGSPPPGAAYVFQEPGDAWADSTSPNATLTPGDSVAGDRFGAGVSMSSDGAALAIGDPSGNASIGEADVFQGIAGTTVGCEPGTDGVGQQTTCTATITDEGIGAATPTGTVGFATDSAGTFGSTSCALTSSVTGTSSCHVAYTPTAADSGTHTITVTYSGDDKHAGATGQTPVAIDHVTTTTTVACSPSPLTVGDTANCTATVTASSASAGPPAGNVSFTTNGPGKFSTTGCTLPAGSGAIAGCKFTYTASAIGPGTHQLTADYSGDGAHAASQGSDPLGVAEDSTHTAVSCSPASVAVGKPTTCTATVIDAGGGGLPPTGRVTGKSIGAGTFSTCPLATFGATGARCTLTYKPANAGTPSPHLTFTYAGDDNHFASSANALLNVRASGAPAVTVVALSVRGGRIVVKLACPKTEAYCKVSVTIAVGSRTLAAGSVKVRGGSAKSLALKPKPIVLHGLRAGRHGAVIGLAAADQAGHHKHESVRALLTAGKHFKLVLEK
jgi:Bacterial Ig-like domain (group 3)/FG-GAP repeat